MFSTIVRLCGLALTVFALLSGCNAPEKTQSNNISVFVSILPQEYFVERIGGTRVRVQALVVPGQSPATYFPTQKQMAALSQADIFFRIGVPFENALIPKIEKTMDQLIIVDTRKGITLRKMEMEHIEDGTDTDHDHDTDTDAEPEQETEGDHEETAHNHADGDDPHIWLDPRLVILQARTITDALIAADPDAKSYYLSNYDSFVKDLEALHTRLASVLHQVKGKTLLVFHPTFGYFADAYGLEQIAIEISGKEPTARQLAHLIEKVKKFEVKVIFVQPQFSQKSAAAIAEAIGGTVVALDPLSRDYIRNLEEIARKIEQGLTQ